MPSFGGATLALSAATHSLAHSKNKTIMIVYLSFAGLACLIITIGIIFSIYECCTYKKKHSTSSTSTSTTTTSSPSSATNNPLFYNPLYMETPTQKYERERREKREKKNKLKKTMRSTSSSSSNTQPNGMTQTQTQTKRGQENNWNYCRGVTEVPPPVYESVYKDSRVGSKAQGEEEVPAYKPRVRRRDSHL